MRYELWSFWKIVNEITHEIQAFELFDEIRTLGYDKTGTSQFFDENWAF